MSTLARGRILVACHGHFVDDRCREAMAWITRDFPDSGFRFVMLDWLEEDELKDIAVFWMVDPAADAGPAIAASHREVPLVLPSEAGDLEEVCAKARRCVRYSQADEAVAGLLFAVHPEW